MTFENQNYQSDILEYAVNQCLNKLLSCDNEDALNVIANQRNDLVWKIATEIYQESGHQIDFSFIKNLLDLRSNLLENQIAEEQRAKADLEARRLEQIAKPKELDRERREKDLKQLQAFKQANPEIDSNYESFDIFIRIKNIIVYHLEIDRETINFNTYIMKDLSADEIDNMEIVMAIEEEFDIEISDDDLPTFTCRCVVSGGYGSYSSYSSSYSLFDDWNIEKMFYLVVQKI